MLEAIEALRSAGHNETSALVKAKLLGQCCAALGQARPPFAFYVPGRLEFLGKHTDYAGGRSVVAAIDRGFVVAARPLLDARVIAHALDRSERMGFELHAELRPDDSGWANYVMTVAQRLAKNFGPPLRGVEFAFASDLPPAAGMSSSSALVVAAYLALDAANAFHERPRFKENIRTIEDLAGYLGTCENGQSFGTLTGARGVGTFGGSEDHTAILCAQPGALSIYSYAPVRAEGTVDWPRELALIIASSGVVAEKTSSARDQYNRIALLATALMEALGSEGWNKPTLAAAIGDDREAAECARRIIASARHSQYRSAELLSRFDAFAMEHQRLIPLAIDAIRRRDWPALTDAVDASQNLAEHLLQNQTRETVALVEQARALGAIAASSFGAGFGGSVWAAVPSEDAAQFTTNWTARHRQAFPSRQSQVFPVACVGGASRLTC